VYSAHWALRLHKKRYLWGLLPPNPCPKPSYDCRHRNFTVAKEKPKPLIFPSNHFYSLDVWGRKVGILGIFKWLFHILSWTSVWSVIWQIFTYSMCNIGLLHKKIYRTIMSDIWDCLPESRPFRLMLNLTNCSFLISHPYESARSFFQIISYVLGTIKLLYSEWAFSLCLSTPTWLRHQDLPNCCTYRLLRHTFLSLCYKFTNTNERHGFVWSRSVCHSFPDRIYWDSEAAP
jgi:hypothetical protein